VNTTTTNSFIIFTVRDHTVRYSMPTTTKLLVLQLAWCCKMVHVVQAEPELEWSSEVCA